MEIIDLWAISQTGILFSRLGSTHEEQVKSVVAKMIGGIEDNAALLWNYVTAK